MELDVKNNHPLPQVVLTLVIQNYKMSEETLIIETPEHVELNFALASLGNRFLACAIDHALQIFSVAGVYLIFYAVSSTFNGFTKSVFNKAYSGDAWTIAILTIIVFLIFFGYFTFFETIWSGQTPGKRLLHLRVIKEDGRPISFFEAFSRNLIRFADSMITPYYSIGIITLVANERSKRLGDFVAGTVVIKERRGEAPSFADIFESDDAADRGFDVARKRIAQAVDFTGEIRSITRTEIEVVEAFLRRRYDLPELPRQWMAWRIAMPILEKIRPSFDQYKFTYEGFLEELLSRYRRH